MRTRLPDRRPSTNTEIEVVLDGRVHRITITVGADRKEVFCSAFKSGTALNFLAADACILLSRLLQHGDHPQDLVRTLSKPPSLIGAIAEAVSEMTDEGT